jgi:acetyl esterase/lipase
MNPDESRLWADPAPGAHGDQADDVPTLTAFLPPPEKRNGASILVVPGGGYWTLSVPEGEGYGRWLAELGLCAYVLKYRIAMHGYHHPSMILDATRALRTVRHAAREQHLDLKRIAVIGSSAGGHLAATLLTHFDEGKKDAVDPIDRESSRPDLGILCYPVISFVEYVHVSSRTLLIGEKPPDALARELSAELHVTDKTPPCFVWAAVDDDIVPVENSMLFASALRHAKVPFTLHLYEKGGHGWGLGDAVHPAPPWASECAFWLRERKFI